MVHADADEILPYTVSGVYSRTMNHMARLLGSRLGPAWNIEKVTRRHLYTGGVVFQRVAFLCPRTPSSMEQHDKLI